MSNLPERFRIHGPIYQTTVYTDGRVEQIIFPSIEAYRAHADRRIAEGKFIFDPYDPNDLPGGVHP